MWTPLAAMIEKGKSFHSRPGVGGWYTVPLLMARRTGPRLRSIAGRVDGTPRPPSMPRASSRRRGERIILLADDTSDTRELYKMYFTGRGFRVLTADNGETAVRVAEDSRPDVIVMDLAMPGMSGITATKRIKTSLRSRRCRVIIFTGFPDRAMEQGALEAGADAFLTKPCLPEDLERHVRELLRPRGEKD